MGNMPAAGISAALVLLVGACSTGSGPSTARTPSPRASPSAVSSAPVLPGGAGHVFVIVMENRSFSQAMAQPYTAELAAKYALATNYHAVAHPSLPNYLALTSGSTWGVTDDAYHRLPAGGIGAQLTQAGLDWRAYMEGMGGDCLTDTSDYAVKHNPFAYYGGACPSNVVPLTQLQGDLAAGSPAFVWITPDLCHDGHDCSAATADDFLRDLVPRLLATQAWQSNGLLLITWDEDDGSSSNQVPALVIAPSLRIHSSEHAYDHYSLLATVEDRLGLPRLGKAAQATPMSDFCG